MTSSDALAAGDVLARELKALADRGLTTPCQREPDFWFAEHRAQQAVAAEACGWCPILEPCKAYADLAGSALYGVWGGIPRVARPNTQPRLEEL